MFDSKMMQNGEAPAIMMIMYEKPYRMLVIIVVAVVIGASRHSSTLCQVRVKF